MEPLQQWANVFGIEGDIYAYLEVGLLILARLLAILTLVPFMGGKLVPNQVKVATAGALSLIIFPIAKGSMTSEIPGLGPIFTVYIMKEVFIGIIIGFVGSLLFQALEAAGQFLDTARGSSLASVLIPELGESGPIMANLKVQLAVVLFLIFNGHLYFIRAICESFIILPVDKFPSLGGNSSQLMNLLLRESANVLVIGMQIVAPALIAIFLVDV
jgi:flagellar biosynthesis protein FliR